MILDSIANIGQYATLHPAFERAVRFVVDNVDMPDGRYVLDGDNLFVTFTETELRRAEDAPIEAHRRYIDIQIVLNGTESYGWRAVSDCRAPKGEFDTANDIIFYNDSHTTTLTAHGEEFVIFFPSDGHAPLIGSGTVRKAIIKVAI